MHLFDVASLVLLATAAHVNVAALPATPQDGTSTGPVLVRTPGKRPFRAIRNRNDIPLLRARANRVIPVVVGGPQNTFAPNVVTAAVGDVLQFQFANGNHTVTQSAGAAAACAPVAAAQQVPGVGGAAVGAVVQVAGQGGAAGVHSGHIPFADGQTTVGTFNMPVESTDPMFLYCATGTHCQQGMVLVVNPADDAQIVDYVKASQSTTSSTDGGAVAGGTVGTLALSAAAFVPAPPKAAAAAAPVAAAAALQNATVNAVNTTAPAAPPQPPPPITADPLVPAAFGSVPVVFNPPAGTVPPPAPPLGPAEGAASPPPAVVVAPAAAQAAGGQEGGQALQQGQQGVVPADGASSLTLPLVAT